ncbi:MAG: hypothetical protein JNM98_06750 [Rhodocyclaceae bacterium]|nr:hypothetical protein [Rhodocyclaceae bacterium]
MCAFVAPAAKADDGMLHFSSFGTLGAAYHRADSIEYRRSIDQSDGAMGGKVNYDIDSLIGVQLNANFGQGVEGVVQAVSRQQPENNWNPKTSWAFLRYAPNESWEFRVGRVGLDLLLFSETRNIGYSYLPIRPAPEVVGLSSIDHLDGFDLRLRQPVGTGIASLKFYAGTSQGKFYNGGLREQAKAKFAALVGEYALDDLILRAWLGSARLRDNGALEPIFVFLRGTGSPYGAALADQMQLQDETYRYAALAGTYNHGPFQFQAAVTRMGVREDNPVLPILHGAYFVAGYRVGEFTPYIAYARAKSDRREVAADLSGSPQGAFLKNFVTSLTINSVQVDQHTLTLGLRYDISSGLDVKFQLDNVRAGRTRLVRNLADTTLDPRPFNMLSVALDFAF